MLIFAINRKIDNPTWCHGLLFDVFAVQRVFRQTSSDIQGDKTRKSVHLADLLPAAGFWRLRSRVYFSKADRYAGGGGVRLDST